MICKRCGEEINPLKPYIVDTHMGVTIGHMHTRCFNKSYGVNRIKSIDTETEE